MAFLFRVLFALFWFAVFAGLVYIAVAIVLRVIRFVVKGLGYETGEFSAWIRSILPKRKRRKKKGDGMHSPPSSTI